MRHVHSPGANSHDRLVPRFAREAKLLSIETLEPLKLTADIAKSVETEHLTAKIASNSREARVKSELPLELTHGPEALQTLAKTLRPLELEALKLPAKLTLELTTELSLEALKLAAKTLELTSKALEVPAKLTLELTLEPIEVPAELPAQADHPAPELSLKLPTEALELPAKTLDLAPETLPLELPANPGVPAQVTADRWEDANPSAAIALISAHTAATPAASTARAAGVHVPARVESSRGQLGGHSERSTPACCAEACSRCLRREDAREWQERQHAQNEGESRQMLVKVLEHCWPRCDHRWLVRSAGSRWKLPGGGRMDQRDSRPPKERTQRLPEIAPPPRSIPGRRRETPDVGRQKPLAG